jgi:hypothetical protein
MIHILIQLDELITNITFVFNSDSVFTEKNRKNWESLKNRKIARFQKIVYRFSKQPGMALQVQYSNSAWQTGPSKVSLRIQQPNTSLAPHREQALFKLEFFISQMLLVFRTKSYTLHLYIKRTALKWASKLCVYFFLIRFCWGEKWLSFLTSEKRAGHFWHSLNFFIQI